MYKPISWKKAGVIVLLLHGAVFGGVVGLNQVKSKMYRAEREKQKEILLSQDTKDMWPVANGKKVATYPEKVSKAIVATTSNQTLQDTLADALASIVKVREGAVEKAKEIEKVYKETEIKVKNNKKQLAEKVEKRTTPVSTPAPKPAIVKTVPAPKPAIVKTVPAPKPTPSSTTIHTSTIKHVYQGTKKEVKEEFLETRMPVVRSNRPKEPDYSTIRYTYEEIVIDPYTGRQKRVKVIGPAPL